ncbi:DUF47 domain-containing protein [Clostridium cellulovorans]|uniref:Putitive phosphate transport regulator n=1 Tax=Clostridium cellulovorans (strain ATCC 35296 / DSM 3052 / OCM 3 / 743B) TaxID=573061 RepID=D9SSX1_CLOC7|nr:DUF47 family protein [Clostridium cellulovorans]ADL52633.1 Putitive phosphate transport regulator [Clostridium cellulovorans 743B]
MFNFQPKQDKFYEMFSETAQNVHEAATMLRANLDSLNQKEANVKNTEALEEKGDEIVRNVIKELNEAFVTPIDREDIYAIVKQMRTILDLINSSMHRFIMFNITESTKEAKLLTDILMEATKELVDIMDELKFKGYKSKKINDKVHAISKIEDSADMLFRETVAELFKTETDPLTVMKWKEIYQILENTIDTCEKVAIIVEGVVIKNA